MYTYTRPRQEMERALYKPDALVKTNYILLNTFLHIIKIYIINQMLSYTYQGGFHASNIFFVLVGLSPTHTYYNYVDNVIHI